MIKLNSIPYYIKSIILLATSFKNPVEIIKLFLGNKDNVKVCLKHSPLCFNVRNVMDIWSIKETFLDDFYQFEYCEHPKGGVIIDIGAGIGEFTIQAAAACPDSKVYGFEPFPESASYFKQNILINTLQNVEAIVAAVTSLHGAMVIDTSSGNPLQYRTQMNNQDGDPVVTVQLSDFLRSKDLSEIELVKIDCEGGEYDILLPLSKEDLRRFKRITMEYHNHLTAHHHSEIIHKLSDAGFSVKEEPSPVHSYLGYIYAQRDDFLHG